MKAIAGILLGFVLFASLAAVVESGLMPDPLAPFRGPDRRLTIPGRALTPELQRLLFHGSDLSPDLSFTFLVPEPSSRPTARFVTISFVVPNLNVVVHSRQGTEANALGHRIRSWFPAVDWGRLTSEVVASVGRGFGWFFDLFTVTARADSVTVDSTTVSLVEPPAATCTTSQTASAGDNAILVMLSNRPATAYTSVTYGSVSLNLIPGTASSGTGFVRAEMWFYQGPVPGGAQMMTATLASGTARHVCATILLQGVSSTTPTTGGTTASAVSTNPTIGIAPAAGEVAFAVLAERGAIAPTAVTGTGATATSLYGIAPTYCTAGGTNLCGAGADMPNPGTAITWTDGANTDWVVAAARVVAAPNCGVAGGNCYRVGAGGTWATGGRWSNTSGGAACGCTPIATNYAFFNGNPTGTTTLAAATTIASIDMTGFTGTIDTTTSNWSLTVNGPFLIQGTFQARASSITINGDVVILTASTVITFNSSTWTVNGTWTNQSTAAGWAAGTSVVTIRNPSSVTLTFAVLAGGTNEFNDLTLDATVTTSITYTMATNAVRIGGTLTIRNSTGGAVGATLLSTSGSNLGVTAGSLTLSTFGGLLANGSTVAINGNVNISAGSAYIAMGSSAWTVTGTWTNASTSASWSAGTGSVAFTSGTGGTMTFAGANLAGSELNSVTFGSSGGTAQTFTMATRALNWSGTLTVSDAASTTALATANLGLTGGALNVGNGGLLTANASTIAVSSVTMTGGTSGTITLTTGSITSSGNWNTTGAGSVFARGTSTVTMSGASTIALLDAANNFNNLTISAAGTVTQAGLVDVAGTLTVNGGATLASGTFTLAVASLGANMAGGITAGAAGAKTVSSSVSIAATGFFNFGGASWTFGGAWTNASTSASWSAGTGTVTFNSGSSRTMTFGNLGVPEFNNVQFSPTSAATFTMATNGLRWAGTLTLNNGATLATASLALAGTGGNLTVSNGGTLAAGTSSVSITNVTMTGGTSGTISAAGSWTVAGDWDTSGAGSTFAGTSSTVTMSGAAKTVKVLNAANGFGTLAITGAISAASPIGTAGPLTVTGTLDTSAASYALTVGGTLTVNGSNGVLRTNASTVSVLGDVAINNASGYITTWAAGSWTVSGAWTNASTSGLWAFAAPITFNAATSQTLTFSSVAVEFGGDVTFNAGASTATFTLATNGLGWSGTLTIQGGSGTTTLVTSGFALSGGALVIGNAGSLMAGASTATLTDVTMTGGTSGAISWTSGTWTVSGTWDTTGAGSILTAGTSTVVMTGSSKSIALGLGQAFYNLSIGGTISIASTVTAQNTLTVDNGAVLIKTGQSIAFNSLLENGSGTIADGSVNVVNFAVTNSDPSNVTTISGFTAWTADAQFTWTHASSIGTSTLTFTIGGNTSGYRFNVTKDSVAFTNGLVGGAGQVVFTMLGSDPVVDVTISSPCGASRYWIGGTGTWSQTTHWSSSSGGINGCPVPDGSNPVIFDANSGGGTVTADQNALMMSLDTPGWTGTIAIGVYDFAVSGSIAHGGGLLTIGASSAAGLTVAGDLTLSGSAAIDGSGAASLLSVSGNMSISSATAYVKMGSGTWTVGGSWTNASTSVNWSAGSGTVLFHSTISKTMTFAVLGVPEFYNVAFQSAAASGNVAFTMSTNPLQWRNVLTIQDGSGSTTTLVTADHSLVGGSLVVGDSGILLANASSVSILDVTMSGGTSGAIVLTGGAWTVLGDWNTSGAGSSFTKGTSLITMSGVGKSARIRDSSNGFYSLSISGTITLGSAIDVGGALTIGGTLTTAAYAANADALTVTGSGSLFADGSTITVRSMDSSAGTLVPGVSTIVVGASGGTIRIPQTVDNLTVNAGIATTFAASVTWSGTLTMTGATIAFNGNLTSTGPALLIFGSASVSIAGSWDTSSAARFTSAGSSVTFGGAGQTIRLGSSQAFAAVTVTGTPTLESNLTATNLTVAASATLTKTNYAIAFNRLTVAGTIADGSVSVSNLAVTNSDGTSLVTITAFHDWSSGSFAWTHASSGTSQTITWTIGGNAAGVPYIVTKNGSPFASGTVDAAGQVVFTMLGSDPDMQVTVGVPVIIPTPGGGWWQTPYFFLIIPGIFLGVAMFAQRQRWRPAKAFLVDERGKMLREFTLDPSCEVSYDQAVQAGVLDAVEKPIKIEKYHGQTVRGDALAVVLLAYGPVTLGQVEFAREMLVQVQDKFEDAIKQRLEEARQEEARLEARSKELDERKTVAEARASELDAIQKRVDEARGQIESDRLVLAAKEEDLQRRELAVVQERGALEEFAKGNEAARAELDARTARVEARETDLSARSEGIAQREASVHTAEERLSERERDIAPAEERLRTEKDRLAQEAVALGGARNDLDNREASVRKDLEELSRRREQFEVEQKELLEFKRSVDQRVANAEAAEAAVASKTEELRAREARLAPLEAELESREARAREDEQRARQEGAKTETALQALTDRARDLEARETALKEDRVVLEEARAAFDSDRREFQDRTSHYEEELRRRRSELDAQAKEIGEAQLRIARDQETFDAARNEKNQALLAREIEVEAREQSVKDKEDAVRVQAEENARRLTDLAAREETLEIESEKLAKGREEVESRNAELRGLAQELDGKAANLRETEAKRAEELRTWQATLESQQSLLKEQRDTFEQESAGQRESWAVRIMRLERREIEVKDQEEKLRQDGERLTNLEDELGRRERAVQEASQSTVLRKAEVDHLKGELEQRTLEIESKERAFKEESARHALELSTRTDALNAIEVETTARRNEQEREGAAQTQRFHEIDAELQRNAQALEAKMRDLSDRERRIVSTEESLRMNESRLEQERVAVQETGRQLEAHQLELAQLKDRYETESARVRAEAEAIGQSLAIKEAELRAERDRVERDATALQDTLGAKAKELAIRDKAIAAQEADLRAEAEDLETRTRELESKEHQAEARLTELSAQAMALVRREEDLNSRDTQIDEAVKKFHAEETEKRKVWENQQTNLRSQQAHLNATSESRTMELTKRSEELEGRERAVRAATTQLDLERSKLEAQSKAHAARAAEAEASWQRSEARLAELKTKEDELLRMRQSFESERSGWATKRAEELKQLEATRDATAVQAQQAERLIAESQRRALVAEEAEKTAKRQANDLAAQLASLERRRSDADKAERAAQAQLTQLQEKSREFAAKEIEVQTAARDVEARLARLATAERETAQASAEVRARKGILDQETARIGNLSEQLAARQKEFESRATDLELKLAEVTTKERTVETELQRANNLLEDLGKKDRDLRIRNDQAAALQSELVRREADLAARDAVLSEGLRNLEKSRHEAELARGRIDDDLRGASAARSDAERLRLQADGMQAEVSKNLRFLQKKALEVLDREEKLRERDVRIEEKEKALDARAEILEGKERSLESDQSASDLKAAKLQAEVDRLKARLAELEKGAGPSTATMDEWKKDVENRVKIIQKKAMDLLDREQKLREKEEELRALAQQLGVTL